MKSYFLALAQEAVDTNSEIEARVRIVSSVRLLLQQVAYGVLEWISKQGPDPGSQPEPHIMHSLRAPTDGSLVDSVEALLVCAEQLGWAGASRVLIREVPASRVASSICAGGQTTALGLLRNLVTIRNDGAEGHGLVGGYNPEAEIDALLFLIEVLDSVTPKKGDGDALIVGPDRNQLSLKFLRLWDGDAPALIRRIKVTAADRVRAYCQVATRHGGRSEFNYDAENPFVNLSGRSLAQPIIWDNAWSPSCFLPDRLTDSFTGRQSQLKDLAEWFGDFDSRACLVFGDGGFGKTTLVLEFLHRVLDEEVVVDWNPKVVCFYTAKRWQWGLSGLEAIGAGRPHLMELLAHVHVLLFAEFPPQSFYRLEFPQAVANLQTRIKQDLGYGRNDVLIVVDNAETLIQSEDERLLLGKELKEVGRRLGRIILTSRRREIIEAAPVGVEQLGEQEAVALLIDRAKKLDIKLVTRARAEDLRAAVSKLERRPIVLEALVQALVDPGVRKIDQAVSRVAQMLRRDLGEFLFADAWTRLAVDVRRLLLLMTRIGDVHDAQSLRICAKIVGVSPQIAEESLEESGGIASVVHAEGTLQIVFSRNFLEFARDKTVAVSRGLPSPTPEEIALARRQYSDFIRNAQRFTGDRIVQAFRTPQARAAHRARQTGDHGESRKLYEQAVLTDSTNGWLLDRYAYFLFHDCRDYSAALHQAKKAVELLPSEGEPWYTRGLIEARMGDFRSCEASLVKAERLGIEVARCSIQRCWAYLKARPVQLGLAEKEVQKLKALIHGQQGSSRQKIELERIQGRLDVVMRRRAPAV